MNHTSHQRVLARTLPVLLVATALTTGAVGPARPVRAKVTSATVSLGGPARPAGWTRSVRTPLATEMVGVTWTGGAAAVEVRARRDGRWSEWTELTGNPDEGPDPGSAEARSQVAAGPVWVGRGVRDLDIRVSEGRPAGLKLVAIHTPRPASPALAPPGAGALPDQPAVATRAQWGADESWRSYAAGCDGSVSYASSVRNAFVHHTDSVNDYAPADVPALLRGIYYFHTHTRQWCDIAYNFLIDRFGKVWEGRYGGITKPVIGAHTGGFNTGATGVSLIGEHGSAAVSKAERAALVGLLAWKLGYHGVDPRASVTVTSGGSTRYAAGVVVTIPRVAGHRDVSVTACPGQLAYDLLPGLRVDVQREQLASRPYPLPGWQPAGGAPTLLVMSAYGGLHPAGGQPAVSDGPYWSGYPIARAAVASAAGGLILDGFGGLHGFGGAITPRVSAYWNGWDIARGLAAGPVDGSGWVLDGFGGLHRFGLAPPAAGAPYFGFDIARGVATAGNRTGGYVLDGYGAVHPFGTAARLQASAYWKGWDIARAVALKPDGSGGYVLDGWGGLHAFGTATRISSPRYTPGRDVARGLTLNDDGDGGWIVDADGFVWPFGSSPSAAPSLTYTGAGVGKAVVLMPASPATP